MLWIVVRLMALKCEKLFIIDGRLSFLSLILAIIFHGGCNVITKTG